MSWIIEVLSRIWQAWTDNRSKKPRISAKASFDMGTFGPTPTLVIDVWNSGSVPVYITQVQLCYQKGGKRPLEVGREESSLILQPVTANPNEPLQPGNGTQYVLPSEAQYPLKLWLEGPEEDVFLTITSPVGELLCLPGSQVQPILRVIVNFPG